jgi:hypothetical protein
MGQKTNPNSFHIQSRLSESSWTIFSKSEYFFLVKQEIGFTEAIQNFFERNNLLIKQISFYLHNESNDVLLFLSFFPLKGLGNFDKSATISPINNILSEKLFSFLNRMGYRTEKRFVFVNLAKYVKDIASSKDEEKKIERKMSFFKREPFYDSGLSLFLVLLHSKNTASLFSKFIAKYFKSYHRSRKLNKFLNFLQVFIHLIVSSSFLTCKPLKGIKIELKGRFNGVPRSKKKKFESGRISLQTITCPVNYSLTHVSTSYGVFSVKVWICDE